MTDTLMTIREMCDAYDVTPRTLRFYESKELLSPIRQGQKRLFTHRDRARLTLILRGKRFGFSLEQIRQLLDMWDGGRGQVAQLDRTIEVGRERLDELRRQRDELDNAIEDLQGQLSGAERMLDAMRTPHAAE
ncbi:MerR family transcriptional regulator [Roseitranquillus sediminis]|uniref:MerR family transcriptional regulator n=1 Tax=Roseitranquillus sediminis TaxID=2809051 RepID=UPI001D0C1F19|nr:MerR family DNA-binding transcriptional regulator [Roseitranquillus sediminis]MBM9594642.1 MerR family DNA-binding transcriptional regulator [Roseitranquillus sediminis]